MKIKLFLLMLFSATILVPNVHAVPLGNSQELSFFVKQKFIIVEPLENLYKKNLLNSEHIKLILFHTSDQDDNSYYALKTSFGTWSQTLKEYRSLLQTEIEQEKIRRGLTSSVSKKWANIILNAAYASFNYAILKQAYQRSVNYNTQEVENIISSATQGSQWSAPQALGQNITNHGIFDTIIMALPVLGMGISFSRVVQTAQEIYMHYTYINSLKKEIAIVDAMIPLVENIEKELAQ
jgi:hypothetical protein